MTDYREQKKGNYWTSEVLDSGDLWRSYWRTIRKKDGGIRTDRGEQRMVIKSEVIMTLSGGSGGLILE